MEPAERDGKGELIQPLELPLHVVASLRDKALTGRRRSDAQTGSLASPFKDLGPIWLSAALESFLCTVSRPLEAYYPSGAASAARQ